MAFGFFGVKQETSMKFGHAESAPVVGTLLPHELQKLHQVVSEHSERFLNSLVHCQATHNQLYLLFV